MNICSRAVWSWVFCFYCVSSKCSVLGGGGGVTAHLRQIVQMLVVLGCAFLWEQNSGWFTTEKKKTSLDITWKQFSAFSQIAARNKKVKRFVIYTGNLVCCINNLKYDVLYDLGTCYITMRVFTFYL